MRNDETPFWFWVLVLGFMAAVVLCLWLLQSSRYDSCMKRRNDHELCTLYAERGAGYVP